MLKLSCSAGYSDPSFLYYSTNFFFHCLALRCMCACMCVCARACVRTSIIIIIATAKLFTFPPHTTRLPGLIDNWQAHQSEAAGRSRSTYLCHATNPAVLFFFFFKPVCQFGRLTGLGSVSCDQPSIRNSPCHRNNGTPLLVTRAGRRNLHGALPRGYPPRRSWSVNQSNQIWLHNQHSYRRKSKKNNWFFTREQNPAKQSMGTDQ